MKKTMIALGIAISAVSGVAHAWTNGEFSGAVDIGGSVTVDDYRQKWSWKVGSAINGFSNVLKDLTNNGTKLTITVNGDKPILLGKTNEAFSVPQLGSLGAIPNIELTDFEGATVTLTNPTGVTNKGLVSFVLPMKDAGGAKIGSVKVNATYAGAVAIGTDQGSQGKLKSLFVNDRNNIFYGGMPTNVPQAELQNGIDAIQMVSLFGGITGSDILAQIKAVHANISSFISMPQPTSENTQYTGSEVFSAGYAMGIANGQTIEVTFNHSVLSSTQWSAPLNALIVYG
ncbi:fimbrial protein [Edwardsiella hoshinae]|uniref:Fimbrial protein n=2 Tax=Edwardsiella hoshinae TaxID=93378 RepID=A0ABM6EKG3_9GAMM|nr:fimbrial protein [Edwardsiella hoshinae]